LPPPEPPDGRGGDLALRAGGGARHVSPPPSRVAARVLEVFGKWTPASDITIHQFVLRVDGEGGFAVTEGDDPVSGAREIAKFSPFLEYTVYPVVDVAEGAAAGAEAVEWRKSTT
jgi:Protein of unknown function (DUF3303)